MWSSFQTGRNWTEWKKRSTFGTKSRRKFMWNTRYNTKCTRRWKPWFKLDTFWKTTFCSTRWNLQVYDSIVRNKLLYGLETVHLTRTQQKKVNACQLRGLRKILGLSTTFVNRSNTNEYVICIAKGKWRIRARTWEGRVTFAPTPGSHSPLPQLGSHSPLPHKPFHWISHLTFYGLTWGEGTFRGTWGHWLGHLPHYWVSHPTF